MAHRVSSPRRVDSVAIGGIADMQRSPAAAPSDANDPQPTKAPSKSRSAAGPPQCYLPLRSTEKIAGETARVHHATWRYGGMAPRGARATRAAVIDADNRISKSWVSGYETQLGNSFSSGFGRGRLHRGQECRHRISLGGGPI